MRVRKKAVEVEATQWFKNGDHPKDDCYYLQDYSSPPPHVFKSEGKIVRYYRHFSINGQSKCDQCSFTMHFHGWIDTLEGGHIVCPGDWIITGVKSENYPCKPDIFEMTYERIYTGPKPE